MTKTGILPPELKSIEQLFTGDSRYEVPKYQRSFAWTSDEIEELWEDVLALMSRGGDYFVGTIVVHRSASGPQEIIDGQQRLACISMIFSAIRKVFMTRNDDRAERIFLSFLGARDFSKDSDPQPKLVLNRINNKHYVQYVLASSSASEVSQAIKVKGVHKSNRLLLQGVSFSFLTK